MKRTLTVVVAALLFACVEATEQMPPPLPSETGNGVMNEPTPPLPEPVDEGGFARPPAGAAAEQGWHDTGAVAEPAPVDDLRGHNEQPVPPATAAPEGDFRGEAKAKTSADATPPSSPARGRASSSTGMGGISRSDKPMPQAAEESRPGLGTRWGETRYSAVTNVPFERDGGRPTYSASLNYNDARGARAMAGSGAYATSASANLSSALSVWLRGDSGNVLPAYRGNGRTVAVGEHNQRYTIMVRNNTNERFEVVLSVDGLDVLDGRDAGYGKRGYLIEAYGVLEVEGFRQSEAAVAAFRFGAVRDSYAALTGSARNVGVIGVAAFGERGYSARLRAYQARIEEERLTYREVQRREEAEPFPNGYARPPLQLAR